MPPKRAADRNKALVAAVHECDKRLKAIFDMGDREQSQRWASWA